MDIEHSNIGTIGAQSLVLEGGKLIAKASVTEGPLHADLAISVDGKVLFDLLISKLPPGIPQEVAKAIEAAVLGV